MAGTVDLLQRGFTGLETRGDALGLDPCLPDALTGLRFRIHYRRHPDVAVTVTHDTVSLGAAGGTPLPVRIREADHVLAPGGRLEVPLRRRPEGR
jgi:trehalose/maltose hydrolase-like predicted phosphorylase